MKESTGLDERAVEEALRQILDRLDRQLAWAVSLIPLAIITIIPVLFFLLWHIYDWRFVRAAPTAAGFCFALAAAYMIWVMAASRLARWRFDQQFPNSTVARGLALRILSEMESPSKAEEKLRLALSSSSPDRIIRHRRGEQETQVETLLANAPTVTDETQRGQIQIGSPAPTEPAKPVRPGGYYDYIPLEPRSGGSLEDDPQP